MRPDMDNKSHLKILDIGGYGGKTREFFPEDEVTVLDLYDIDEPCYVKGDALDMPFADDAFDVAVSFDVLEHIPREKRRQFIQESTRVSQHLNLIAAPFYSKKAAQTEFALNHYYKNLTGFPHQWLQEHIDYGLPVSTDIEKYLTENDLYFSAVNSNEIHNWTWIQFAVLFTASSNVSSQYLEQLYQFYNTHLSSLEDYDENSYRRVYIASPRELPQDLDREFQNNYSWEDRLRLKEITFQHIAQMQQNAQREMVNHELNWYQLMVERLNRENKHLHYLLAMRDNELQLINQSRGWRIIRFLRRFRSGLWGKLAFKKGKHEG
ncbi:hypothetical protein BRC19_00750 [Candidatus Saccharibacteria bacterium QS_5_54_17]|nr:MAG: hypothetical protein BRC19_00750 [Candidatus Saccharibacteria bacterium QS_5_54_17]